MFDGPIVDPVVFDDIEKLFSVDENEIPLRQASFDLHRSIERRLSIHAGDVVGSHDRCSQKFSLPSGEGMLSISDKSLNCDAIKIIDWHEGNSTMSRPETGSARLPQLSTLRVFEAAARHESFIRAARELNVTQGAVSKQIKNLETDLKEQLFHRRNRIVALTHKGRWLAGRLSSIFAEIEGTMADFRKREAEQPLIVSCEPTLCLKLLIPNIAELKRETGLDICLLAAGGRIDFHRDHVDLAVRRDDFPLASGIHSRPLAAEAVGLVCSPHLRLDSSVSALHTKSRPDAWSDWKTEMPEVSGSNDVVYEHFYLAIEAAAAGQGIAVASIHMVDADLASGRLSVVRSFKKDGTGYVGLSRRAFHDDPRKSRFMTWLAAKMEAHLSSHLVD